MHEYIKYKIIDIRDECIDTKTFVLDKKLDAKPGNFVMLWLPGIGEKPISISFSNPMELTVKKFGPFTTELFKLKPGSNVWARGPYGNSFLDFVDDNSKKYIIAGGTGAAPLKFLVESLKHGGEKPTVFLGVRNRESLLFEDHFRKFAELLIATSDGSYGNKGLTTDLFDRTVDLKENSQFFICGPEKMMIIAAQRAAKYTSPKNIILSMERYMKCGCGVCGGCEINGLRVCVDGPIFSYNSLLACSDFGRKKRNKNGKMVDL